MGNLGKLNIVISAVNKTQKVFNTVKKGLSGVKSAVGTALKAFGALTAVIGATAGALTILFKKSFDYLDAIGKISSRTGATTDVIQAFQLSALQSGASVETANKAIQKFAKMVGEARTGLKTYTDIFDRYNVSLIDATGSERSFNDVLLDVMTGMKESGDQFQRNRDLAQLFGRAGQELTNTILMGGKAFELYVQKQKELGLILSGRVIKATEEFNDRLTRIGFTFRVIRDAITTAFLPILDQVAEDLENHLSRKNAREMGVNFSLGIIDALIFLVKGIDETRMSLEKNFLSIEKGFAGINVFGGVVKGIFQSIFMGKYAAASKSFNDNLKNTSENLNTLLKTSPDPKPNEFLQGLTKSLEKYREMMENFAKDGEGGVFDNATDGLSKFEQQLRQMVADIQTPLSTLKESFTSTGSMIGDTIVSSMKKFEDTIVDGLMNGKFAFKDFANFVIKELLRIAIRKIVIQNLVNALTGGFASLFAPKPTPQATLNRLPATLEGVDYQGGGFTGYGTRTGGIDGRGGFPAILHPNETVIDHTRGGAGMGVNITYNIQAFDSKDTLAAITENAPTISAIIEQQFNRRGRRGFVS